ncbi:hypothetical protein CRG98_018234 [Punica granatum]|uniref:Uncharacterized protein n=1 Tax=Punica granatum TaxID=22663 RepID=A0A2I0K108_PUNGR|nr:hypothetical protein CRG98_018234 [Punica granatum]
MLQEIKLEWGRAVEAAPVPITAIMESLTTIVVIGNIDRTDGGCRRGSQLRLLGLAAVCGDIKHDSLRRLQFSPPRDACSSSSSSNRETTQDRQRDGERSSTESELERNSHGREVESGSRSRGQVEVRSFSSIGERARGLRGPRSIEVTQVRSSLFETLECCRVEGKNVEAGTRRD